MNVLYTTWMAKGRKINICLGTRFIVLLHFYLQVLSSEFSWKGSTFCIYNSHPSPCDPLWSDALGNLGQLYNATQHMKHLKSKT
jgi:hypothetical protein